VLYSLGGWRYVGYLLVILALGASLWWVKSRIDRSYDADRMQVELRIAKLDIISLKNKVKIVDAERLDLSIKLGDARVLLDQKAKNAAQRVKVIVRDNPDCRLGPDAVSLLNDARRADYGLPAPTSRSPAAPKTTPEN
jgi:hypothetical protein